MSQENGKLFRVPIHNTASNGTRCGYGYGKTKSEAVLDALRKAKERSPVASYNFDTGAVDFHETPQC